MVVTLLRILPSILFIITTRKEYNSDFNIKKANHLYNNNNKNININIVHFSNSKLFAEINNTSQKMPSSSPVDYLTFLSQICGALKRIKRTGWIRHKIPLPESDADHMHRCAMCAMLVTTQQPIDQRDQELYDNYDDYKKFHPSNVDSTKLLRMALTHDVCEAIAGDITPFCSADAIATKHEKEEAAMLEIRNIVGDPLGLELFELWREYEEQQTVEALYCKDIDKFEMVMQAYEYELEHLSEKQTDSAVTIANDEAQEDGYITPLRTFYQTTNDKMKSPMFRKLDAELRQKREILLLERGWKVTNEERQNY